MCWANKSPQLPTDPGVGTTCGNGAWASRDWERREQLSSLKAGVEKAQNQKYLGTDNRLPVQRKLSGAVACTFLPCEHLLEIHKRGSSGRACHLGVMAKSWAELWWPCPSSWTAHMEKPWWELHHGLALCSFLAIMLSLCEMLHQKFWNSEIGQRTLWRSDLKK